MIELIYPSKAAMKRMRSLYPALIRHPRKAERLARALRVSSAHLIDFTAGGYIPFIDMYLTLARECRWRLSYDVNYMYAHMTYPPSRLIPLASRVMDAPRNTSGLSRYLMQHMPFPFEAIRDTLTYGHNRSLSCFASLIYAIRNTQRKRGMQTMRLED